MSRQVDDECRAATFNLAQSYATSPVHRRCDLLALGITDALIVAMLRRGDIVRLRHGVFAVRELFEAALPPERHRIDLAAAIAAGRSPVWAFGTSGALMHDLPLPFSAPDHIEVVRQAGLDERALRQPSRHRLELPSLRVVTGPVDPASTTVIRGIPCVDPALAAVSAAAAMTSARWRVALLDGAMWRGATPEAIQSVIDLWRHVGHRAQLLSALDRARPGAQTVLETFSRLAFIEGGLPEPILQQAFYDDDGLIGYADMWWPSLNVIGEADGLIKYATRADVIKEKLREDRLRARGPGVVRWTLEDLEERPQSVIAAIWRASRPQR